METPGKVMAGDGASSGSKKKRTWGCLKAQLPTMIVLVFSVATVAYRLLGLRDGVLRYLYSSGWFEDGKCEHESKASSTDSRLHIDV